MYNGPNKDKRSVSMKNFRIMPFLILLVVMFGGYMLFTSGMISAPMLILLSALVMGGMVLMQPKQAAPRPAAEIEEQVTGNFARDAFADDSELQAAFYRALKDYAGNMPISARNKLEKLAPRCRNDQQRYAVAMGTALCHLALRNYKDAIDQYNRALVLNPTSELARTIGSCHQRLGELYKAKDSYEFALELDPDDLEARSSLATACVASRNYEAALDHACAVLKRNENHASALATAAICSGVLGDTLMYKHYTGLAVENGYDEKKIKDTVTALKK